MFQLLGLLHLGDREAVLHGDVLEVPVSREEPLDLHHGLAFVEGGGHVDDGTAGFSPVLLDVGAQQLDPGDAADNP